MGLRAHGDLNAATRESFLSGECKNAGRDLRLYNRSTVKPMYFPADLFDGRLERPLKTLVVRRKDAVRNYVAYKIAKEIGADTPANGLVQLEINGISQCTVLAAEHISIRQFAPIVAPGGALHRYKDQSEDSTDYKRLHDWLKSRPGYHEIASVIDIERFTAHILANLYLANRDWVQGAAIKPAGESRWYWVLWDLDTTFREYDYSQSAISLLTRRRTFRTMLFSRLVEFPGYRTYFRRFASDRLGNRLDAKSVARMFDAVQLFRDDDIAKKRAIYFATKGRAVKLLNELTEFIDAGRLSG